MFDILLWTGGKCPPRAPPLYTLINIYTICIVLWIMVKHRTTYYVDICQWYNYVATTEFFTMHLHRHSGK